VGQLFAGSTAVQFLLDLIFFDGPVGEEAATIKDIAIPRQTGQLLQGPAILVVSARDFLAKRNEMNMADTWDVQWMSQHATLKLSRP